MQLFVYNLKINGNRTLKILLVLIILTSILILFLSIYKLYSKSNFLTNDEIYPSSLKTIDSNEYTNILKEVHDDLNTYIGQQISFSGYIYRVSGLKNDEFIVARDMIINSDSQSVVVGFLCSTDNANSYKNGTWVNVTGTIIKGYYHGEIPVIDINEIEEILKPDDEFVYPPDNTYIPTSIIL